jgi:hypothetical protein
MPKDMVEVRRPPTNQFAEEPVARIGRSQFDRSHGLKTTFDASYLYPILVDEVLPGDTFTCKLNGFVRILSPLDSPIMDNIILETFFFFIPNRLVWDNWQYFQGEHDDAGAQDTDYTIPILSQAGSVSHNSGVITWSGLAAHMGIPHGAIPDNIDISALPFRAYNLVYNEWFRDQNLIDSLDVRNTSNGPDNASSYYQIRKSAKKHDYFTSALPYLQKGDAEAVSIGTTAPVIGIGVDSQTVDSSVGGTVYESDGGSRTYVDHWLGSTAGRVWIEGDAPTGAYPQIFADLSAATGVTINNLRQSVAIQRLLERDARGGTRYVEMIKAHFGVTSPDFRLQRPEFLGGGKSFINVTPVANTSDTATIEQGELRAYGTGVVANHSWAKSFTEHGIILGIVRARGDITYFKGLERMWSRSTRYDFYIPALANLGEQAIYDRELWVANNSTDDTVFGYQERWSEYRQKFSRVAGVLNPDASSAISQWHLAEDFAGRPDLNQVFVEDQTPMSRVITTTTGPDFLADFWFDYKCARPIPVHSIPSLMGMNF